MSTYTYATKNNNSYEIIHNVRGILTFKSESDAERHFKGSISGTKNEDLECMVLNITNLVEKGFIPKKGLNRIWR